MVTMYLAHPLDSRHEVARWERAVEANHPGLSLINPFYDRERPEIQALDRGEKVEHDFYKIVEDDLAMMRPCNGLLAIIDGTNSYGTIQEMVYARLFHMPTCAIITNGEHEHIWLRYHTMQIFQDYDEFYAHVPVIIQALTPFGRHKVG